MDHWDYVIATRNLQNGGPQYKNNLWMVGVAAFATGVFIVVMANKYKRWNEELMASVRENKDSLLPKN